MKCPQTNAYQKEAQLFRAYLPVNRQAGNKLLNYIHK